MTILGSLTDVDVSGAEFERPRDRALLVLEGGTGQIEVHLILTGFLLVSRTEPDPEPGVLAR